MQVPESGGRLESPSESESVGSPISPTSTLVAAEGISCESPVDTVMKTPGKLQRTAPTSDSSVGRQGSTTSRTWMVDLQPRAALETVVAAWTSAQGLAGLSSTQAASAAEWTGEDEVHLSENSTPPQVQGWMMTKSPPRPHLLRLRTFTEPVGTRIEATWVMHPHTKRWWTITAVFLVLTVLIGAYTFGSVGWVTLPLLVFSMVDYLRRGFATMRTDRASMLSIVHPALAPHEHPPLPADHVPFRRLSPASTDGADRP